MRFLFISLLIQTVTLCSGQIVSETISGSWFICEKADIDKCDTILLRKQDTGSVYCGKNNCTYTKWDIKPGGNLLITNHHFGCPDDPIAISYIRDFQWTFINESGILLLSDILATKPERIKYRFHVKKQPGGELCLKKLITDK